MVGAKKESSATDEASTANTPEIDYIWGINAVYEALQQGGGLVREVLVQQGKTGIRLQQIIHLAQGQGLAVRFVDVKRLGLPYHCRHQGVVARQGATQVFLLDHLLDHIVAHPDTKPQALLVLDSLQDPHNLGSILRSALAAGFAHVLMTRERSVSVTGTVARTSAGAVAHLHLYQVVNLAEALSALKKHGYWIYGTVAEQDAESIYATDFSGAICVVIGSEGKGLRPLVRKQCDFLVTIPMRATFNSLNASVAAAVVMFEIARCTSR